MESRRGNWGGGLKHKEAGLSCVMQVDSATGRLTIPNSPTGKRNGWGSTSLKSVRNKRTTKKGKEDVRVVVCIGFVFCWGVGLVWGGGVCFGGFVLLVGGGVGGVCLLGGGGCWVGFWLVYT